MHKTIRIIATDLDGTMLHHDNEVSVRNYRAIEHAVNEGMLYVVATGRCRSIVPISNLPVMDYLIAENGAVIYRGGTEQVLYRQAISAAQLREAIRIGKKYHAFVELVSDGRILIEEELLRQTGQLRLTRIQEEFLREKRYLMIDSFEKYCSKVQENQDREEIFRKFQGYKNQYYLPGGRGLAGRCKGAGSIWLVYDNLRRIWSGADKKRSKQGKRNEMALQPSEPGSEPCDGIW